MARATVTCTCKHCGKQFEMTTIKQNRREADRWESWAADYYDECDECRKERIERERAEENEAAAAASSERKWPTLTGSEKQVAWANNIRLDFMTRLEEKIAGCEPGGDLEKAALMMKAYILRTYTGAKFWIDHRGDYYQIERQAGKDYRAEHEAAAKIAAEATETAAEPVVQEINERDVIAAPENQTHVGTVEIKVSDRQVSASYVREDAFREMVKGLDYRWSDGAWRKSISDTTGSAAERAAELGNKLLNAGYAIHIADPEIRAAAINGDYEPQTYRWIGIRKGGEYDGWLSISWGRNDDLYRDAKALPKARYDRPNVVIPVNQYEYVEDFAVAYCFKFTSVAQEAIAQQRRRVEMVVPAAAKNAEYDEHDIADVLNSSREVLQDLIDD